MKILIITQKVDYSDPVLGFFHEWINKFSHYSSVKVLCLEKGQYIFNSNVEVVSMGKEAGFSKPRLLFNFYKHILTSIFSYDSVFVHMNPMYIFLGGIIWKVMRKKVFLWYVHPLKNKYLKASMIYTCKILTVNSLSFPIASSKVVALGHGIDTNKFRMIELDNRPIFLTVGRISKIKNIPHILRAIQEFRGGVQLILIGGIDRSDKKFFKYMKSKINELQAANMVQYIGQVSPNKLVDYYNKSMGLISATPTGSFDKVVLEAMSCERPVIHCNKILRSVLPDVYYDENDLSQLVLRIKYLLSMSHDDRIKMGSMMRKYVVSQHNLDDLINKIRSVIYENKL